MTALPDDIRTRLESDYDGAELEEAIYAGVGATETCPDLWSTSDLTQLNQPWVERDEQDQRQKDDANQYSSPGRCRPPLLVGVPRHRVHYSRSEVP